MRAYQRRLLPAAERLQNVPFRGANRSCGGLEVRSARRRSALHRPALRAFDPARRPIHAGDGGRRRTKLTDATLLVADGPLADAANATALELRNAVLSPIKDNLGSASPSPHVRMNQATAHGKGCQALVRTPTGAARIATPASAMSPAACGQRALTREARTYLA